MRVVKENKRTWLLLNYQVADSKEILNKEERLASQVGEGEIPPLLELWIASRQCFIVGKVYAQKLKKYELDILRGQGLPVFFRQTGGQVILHDSTCLNFGIIVPRKLYPEIKGVDQAFLTLSSGVVYFLKKMGISVKFGRVKTFCPGPYDLIVEGKKIAGTALLFRGKFCLLQGTLFVNTGYEYIRILKRFYSSLEDEILSLRTLTNRWIKMEDVSKGIIEGYKQSLKINFITPINRNSH